MKFKGGRLLVGQNFGFLKLFIRCLLLYKLQGPLLKLGTFSHQIILNLMKFKGGRLLVG